MTGSCWELECNGEGLPAANDRSKPGETWRTVIVYHDIVLDTDPPMGFP